MYVDGLLPWGGSDTDCERWGLVVKERVEGLAMEQIQRAAVREVM